MTITDVKNKVISDAEEKALEIKSESEKKLEEIKILSQSEKKNLENVFLKESARKLAQDKKKFLSLVDRDIKLRREKLKRDIIEGVLRETLQALESVSDQELKKFAENMIKQLPKNLKGEILVSSDKSRLFEGLAKEHHSLSIKEDNSVNKGFLVEGEDFLYDFTFKNLLELQKSDLELHLSEILF